MRNAPAPHRQGMTLLEVVIASAIFLSELVAASEALVSTMAVVGTHETGDALAQEAAAIKQTIADDLMQSGWHFASSLRSDYAADSAAEDRALVYYPFVVQQSPDGPGGTLDAGLPTTPTLHEDANLSPNAGVVVDFAHVVRDADLVVLDDVPAELPGAPSDFTTWFSEDDIDALERQAYTRSYHARSQELVFLKIRSSSSWAPSPHAIEHETLFFDGADSDWTPPSEEVAGGGKRPWSEFAHDELRILRMSDWDVLPDSDDADGDGDYLEPIGYRDASNSDRSQRVDDVVIQGGWLSQAGNEISIQPRWQTKQPRSDFANGNLASEHLREYLYCLVPSPVGFGRLVRCFSVDFADTTHAPPDRGRGVGPGEWVSRDGTRAMVIDAVLSDDVVRIVFDTYRSVDDGSLGLNEVRVRLFLARQSTRTPGLVLKRAETLRFTMRTANNGDANRAVLSVLGRSGIEFPY